MMPTHNREARRKAARHIERESRKYDDTLVQVHHPDGFTVPGQLRVFRNRKFLVQEFAPDIGTEAMVKVRLSINLVALDGDRWLDGIGWEELQSLKNAMGYAAFDAVEVYPRQADVVNVANMRHLWILNGLLPFAWGAGRLQGLA